MEIFLDGVEGLEEWKPKMIQGMHTYPSPSTSTQTTEMDFHSGSRDLTVPYVMFMRMLEGKLLYSGKPLGMPSDSNLVGKASQSAAPNLDPRRIGAMRDQVTALEGLGQPKNEGDLLPASLSPSHFSESALCEENNERISLPKNKFCMRNVKEEIRNMTSPSMDVSTTLSLLSSVDLYWKYQLLVQYSKYLHTVIILDGMQQEEN